MKIIALFKDLFFRLLTLTIAVVLIVKGFNSNKNNYINLKQKKPKTRSAKLIPQEDRVKQLEHSEERLLLLVEKLNSYIDEQSHLLSYLDDNLKEKDIETLLKNINSIKKEAQKRKVAKLIDVSQIEELETQLQIYQRAIDKNKT